MFTFNNVMYRQCNSKNIKIKAKTILKDYPKAEDYCVDCTVCSVTGFYG